MENRIKFKFQELQAKSQTAFVAYICAGDPDYETSVKALEVTAKYADIIELGVPFMDPAGDGPVIESASKRAIAAGMTLQKTLKMVADFRQNNDDTPIILMGYYNSFLKYGLDEFFSDASKAGVDGLIIVDLPLEERVEIAPQLHSHQVSLINLISPLSDEQRIAQIADQEYSSGFLYLISMLGITGTKDADAEFNAANLAKVRANSDLPVAIGFGVKTPAIARQFKEINPDAIVIGSTIVKEVSDAISDNISQHQLLANIEEKVKEFHQAIKG